MFSSGLDVPTPGLRQGVDLADPLARERRPLSYDPESPRPSVVVVGCGAIGLPLAAAFTCRGFDVLGVDVDPARVAQLSAGNAGDSEIALTEAVATALVEQRLRFTTMIQVVARQRSFVLTVPTPIDADRRPVLVHLEAAFATAAQSARDGDLIIVRSTVPVGTTRWLAETLLGSNILVACVPDRSAAGRAFQEQLTVPNLVGAVDRASAEAAVRLFAPLGDVIQVSSPEAAEAAKLFANVQRDATFALANQFALVAEHLRLDYGEICDAAATGYPRFTLGRPGPVGGPCLSKDSYLLAHSVGGDVRLAALPLTARRVNDSLLDHTAAAVTAHLARMAAERPVIVVLGLAFKGSPPLADQRGSFGAALVEHFRTNRPAADIRGFDPVASGEDRTVLDRAIVGADVVILANDHWMLTTLDPDEIARIMRRSGLIYDLCGALARRPAHLSNDVSLQVFGNGVSHRIA